MEQRIELVEKLNNLMEQFYPIAKGAGRDIGVFLHQSINKHADEETLKKIIRDVDDFIYTWKE